MGTQPTIEEHLNYLQSGLANKKSPPAWPPDVFAVVASILSESGSYQVAANSWPPPKYKDWALFIQRVGKNWRRSFKKAAPKQVQNWWKQLIKKRKLPLHEICSDVSLSQALLQMLAAADEASRGAGVPSKSELLDSFDFRAGALLELNDEGSTLCDALKSSSVVRVLPKMHAPQTGFTLRSFSHHLSFIAGNEIRPKWYTVGAESDESELTLLLLPWPKSIKASSFLAVRKSDAVMKNLPKRYGFFEYSSQNNEQFADDVLEQFKKASMKVGHIDAVVLPEACLSDEEYDQINAILVPQGVYLIAGVSGPRDESGTLGNCVRYNIPLAGHQVPVRQAKHHRWQLNKSQIQNYRLGAVLSEKKIWWEHIPIVDRSLNFVSLRPWLAVCVLICEDLARPDPVGDVIRAIGPNLVIALLLDGPQIPDRWPGRYATVLADDPGCSVLTLTSGGMSRMSRPPGKKGMKKNAGFVALWKDVRGSAVGIDLKSGDSIVLELKIEEREEWTADGRSDGKAAGYPLLNRVTVLRDGGKSRRYKP